MKYLVQFLGQSVNANNVYFTSDTHFSHRNIIKYCNRPFNNVFEHDKAILENWNSVVTHEDCIFHLGDFSFGSEEYTESICKELKGYKILVSGNHDKIMRRETISNKFKFSENYLKIKVTHNGSKYDIVLFHYPIESWDMKHHGSFMLHGHTHKDLDSSKTIKRVDVGVDTWNYKPVSLNEIIRFMEKK